jgi:hypothetical protein
LNFINQHFFVGIDVHLKQWKVTIRSAGIELKTFPMHPVPLELIAYLQQHYPNGIYHLVYEAGFCGFITDYLFVSRSLVQPCFLGFCSLETKALKFIFSFLYFHIDFLHNSLSTWLGR